MECSSNLVSVKTDLPLLIRCALTKTSITSESMSCPECSCPLELESLAYAWHGKGVEATVTYRCPECKVAYDKEGNRLERSLIVEELEL